MGRKVDHEGTVYDGEFLDGLYHGKGKLVRVDEVIYEGEFKNGRKDGFGVE